MVWRSIKVCIWQPLVDDSHYTISVNYQKDEFFMPVMVPVVMKTDRMRGTSVCYYHVLGLARNTDTQLRGKDERGRCICCPF